MIWVLFGAGAVLWLVTAVTVIGAVIGAGQARRRG